MSDGFRLSVVIPNRNRAQPLIRAILSIQDQSDGSIDIIVVDDFSDIDLTAEYDWLQRRGVRILYQSQHLRGSAARNRGAEAAKGNFISFLDSDDIWLANRYAQIKAFAARPDASHQVHVAGVCLHFSDHVTPFTQPHWHKGYALVDYVYRDAGRIQTSLLTLPTAIARRFPFDESLRVNQDTDLAMRLDRAGIGFVIDDVAGVIKDETDRLDRVTTARESADWSRLWFQRESYDWSAWAKSGYHLQDRVWRLADSGRRREALISLGQSLFPPVKPRETMRRAVNLIFGRTFYEKLRRVYRKVGPQKPSSEQTHPAMTRWQVLDRQASLICGSIRKTTIPTTPSVEMPHLSVQT